VNVTEMQVAQLKTRCAVCAGMWSKKIKVEWVVLVWPK
jgi:hypothetical protein